MFLALLLWGGWVVFFLCEYLRRDMPHGQADGLALWGLICMADAFQLIVSFPLTVLGLLDKYHRHTDAKIALVLHIAFVVFPFLLQFTVALLQRIRP